MQSLSVADKKAEEPPEEKSEETDEPSVNAAFKPSRFARQLHDVAMC
jgi:hypothetical protein